MNGQRDAGSSAESEFAHAVLRFFGAREHSERIPLFLPVERGPPRVAGHWWELNAHHFHDFFSLVKTAVRTNVVRPFDLMALRAFTKGRRAEFIMRPPHPPF